MGGSPSTSPKARCSCTPWVPMECPLCFRRYALPERAPLALLCGQTLCGDCVEQSGVTSVEDGEITCPLCRACSLAAEIRTNFALHSILERRKRWSRSDRRSRDKIAS